MGDNGIATVIPRRHPGGRPSKATLAALRERNDDLAADLRVAADERTEAAVIVVALARRARMVLGAGRSPLALIDELERIGSREAARAASMVDTEAVA